MSQNYMVKAFFKELKGRPGNDLVNYGNGICKDHIHLFA
jgi:hypothetical protein